MERKPAWFRVGTLPTGPKASRILGIIARRGLHTVCTSAACPNRGACFAEGTATFMILGDVCTRACRFCNVKTGVPPPVDALEPERVAEAAAEMGLRFVVITSVTRDDLDDQGAGAFAETIAAVKKRIPGVGVEVLTPDFYGRRALIETVLEAQPDVFNHNIETVERLTPSVRTRASYSNSLKVLETARKLSRGIPIKSGLMVGLGENRGELLTTFRDLASVGVERLTIGQYLRPTMKHLPVERYYSPEEFDELAEEARAAGVKGVLSGPLVRSSYHAGTFLVTSAGAVERQKRGGNSDSIG